MRDFRLSRYFLVLVFIFLVAAFFRLYQLDKVPPSPSLDEVSIGWNASSILETGKDEFGNRLPVLLRAYDDWRPALYVYLVIPFVKFFGLSPLAVRFPSALLSLLAILATFFLAQEILRGSKWAAPGSLLAVFFLTISPWHLYLSRLGHEVNLGLTLSLLAVLFFVKAIRRKKLDFFVLTAVLFALSFYTYQSQKIFGPPMILALGIIYRKQLWKLKKEIVLAGLVGLILLVPLIKASFIPGAMIRFQGTSIFSQQEEIYQRSSLRMVRNYQGNHLLGLVFDNQKVALGLTVLQAYTSHFDPSWLFFNHGAEKHKVPNLGLFFLWELPLLLTGAYFLAREKFPRENKFLLLIWLLIAPLPAGIATEAPHAMRALFVLPVPQILSALGAAVIIARVRLFRRRLLRSVLIVLGLILLGSSLCFLYHNYFLNFPYEQSDSFQYPLAQGIAYALANENDYQKVVFSNEDHGYQSYMFFLFFSQADPTAYLNQGGTVSGGFAETHVLSRYEFRPIVWGGEKAEGVLYIGNLGDFPDSVLPLQAFRTLEGKEAMVAVGKQSI